MAMGTAVQQLTEASVTVTIPCTVTEQCRYIYVLGDIGMRYSSWDGHGVPTWEVTSATLSEPTGAQQVSKRR